MNIKKGIGITLLIVGIFLAFLYGYTAYSGQESYVRSMCAVEWVAACVNDNNMMMAGMGLLGVGLVFIASGGILVVKSRHG